jgi:hypothetical protein
VGWLLKVDRGNKNAVAIKIPQLLAIRHRVTALRIVNEVPTKFTGKGFVNLCSFPHALFGVAFVSLCLRAPEEPYVFRRNKRKWALCERSPEKSQPLADRPGKRRLVSPSRAVTIRERICDRCDDPFMDLLSLIALVAALVAEA